ncbi:ABC transporter ATP-binding protein [Nordella sp. HKS 07]|uniref:dipeptide ABC transporter ATP-binding protein n=1 Tax=Nordella sp. HKS 07 TaxID=2712222 RepID=UPI0013E10454|nr:ABC transporter ATP-binding protein [Nordella sp. HKS 07]QIG46293.1 ABC transporter ATP-binding protein [Nordella sp. HKS 07]
MAAPANGDPLLSVNRLAVRAGERAITTGVDLTVGRGESIAIVGESGSGKSLTAKAIARLLPPGVSARGEVRLDGVDLFTLPEQSMRLIRGNRISLMLQDPFAMMNPLLKCGAHIEEMLRDRREFSSPAARAEEVRRRLAEVGITDADVAHRMPFQLSGGMCQRVALAAALARDPELFIADEPSTALDVTTQAEIIKLLKRVQETRGMSLILITHDLRLAFSTCERIYVLYAGSVMEAGDTSGVESAPHHPYTLGLLLSEPPADKRVTRLTAIRGTVPRPDDVAHRCSFADRCDWANDRCRKAKPLLAEGSPGRYTACIRRNEIEGEMRSLRMRALEAANSTSAVTIGSLPLIAATALMKTFAGRGGRLVQALNGVSIEVARGESVGLVGESGSGKTTLGRCLLGLETASSGTIRIAGIDASDFRKMSPVDRMTVRRTIQMVFQDPYSTLNPRHSVRRSLAEALRAAGEAGEPENRIRALLRDVGLPEDYADRRPASLSGGERQRVAVARSLAVRPKILVCDEPVSALDVSVQAQILNLFKRLQEEHGLSYLFITHDLAVVRQVVDRLYVLYLGEIVESGETEEVMNRPRHSYTRRLIASIPRAMV